jgi:hypothetical protein
VGRESNRLEEVEAGLIHDPDEVYTEYVDSAHDPPWEAIVAALKAIPRSWLMQETGLDRSTITRLRNGRTRPTRRTRKKLMLAVTAFIRDVVAGKRHLPEDARLALIAATQSYWRERRDEDKAS